MTWHERVKELSHLVAMLVFYVSQEKAPTLNMSPKTNVRFLLYNKQIRPVAEPYIVVQGFKIAQYFSYIFLWTYG